MKPVSLPCSDGARATLVATPDTLVIDFELGGLHAPEQAVYVALGASSQSGAYVLPFAKGFEGSTVFLPFAANTHVFAKGTGTAQCHLRHWDRTMWSERFPASDEFEARFSEDRCQISLSRAALGLGEAVLSLALYAKDLSQNGGWGNYLGGLDATVPTGFGDRTIAFGCQIDLSGDPPTARPLPRLPTAERPRIYQLFVRLFGNTNETRKENGTLAENGTGKFADINDAALESLRAMHFSHIWLTGVLQQATATDYSDIGEPADDPDLLKGLAGSPYAVRDYFDVCPDYAVHPEQRLEEFKALLDRIHAKGMKAIIDFVPNHVARSYHSDIRPDDDFGANDETGEFFDPGNNFYYLQEGSGPLRLPSCRDGVAISPTCKVLEGQCDGLFAPETEFGRVTGNNVVSWSPSLGDWYETVKLNYGLDFTDLQVREYPNGADRDKPIPDTWRKMDAVIAYWQEMGVDGFRCDMAHMVPPEFWHWLLGRARSRVADAFFMAEAYNNDPAKVAGGDPLIRALNNGRGNVMFDLLNAGFDAVYDDPSYKVVKAIYDAGAWANDIDRVRTEEFIFGNSLRYAENHDEVRLAGKEWGQVGMDVGRPATAILFALGTGPVMVYSGQEVGEPAAGPTGFGGDNSRSTLFDYWSMPALVPWVNGHRYDGANLSEAQRNLRDFYGRLLGLTNEPAFRQGTHCALDAANAAEPSFGRVEGDPVGGHWIYACLRHDRQSAQVFLVVANLHPTRTFENVRVRLPMGLARALDLDGASTWTERLGLLPRKGVGGPDGIVIGDIPSLTPFYFELETA